MTEIPEPTIGSLAPDFTLPASSGGDMILNSFREKNNVYLFFVREYN
jgi:peroxiredoxin